MNRADAPRTSGIDLTMAALPAPGAMLQAVERATRDLAAHLGGSGYDPHGLPSLRRAIAVGYGRNAPTASEIVAAEPIADDQIQPASLDLRLGEVAYRVRASFLPGARDTVQDKLERVRPATLGQAARIPGVTPAAVAVLDCYLSLSRV